MNKQIEALKLAEAYIAGMKWSEEANEALAAIREALDESMKQDDWVCDEQDAKVKARLDRYFADLVKREPVHWVVPDFGFLFPSEDAAKRYLTNIESDAEPTPLYAAPVDTKAIRAEALEEAAKVCESKGIPFDIDLWCNSTKKEMTAHTAIALAAVIRNLK